MKRAWLWLKQLWEEGPPLEVFKEDQVAEAVTRIRRKMQQGTWVYTWGGMGSRTLTVTHQNLPTLTRLINESRTALVGRTRIPSDARRSTSSNRGTTTLLVGNYLADEYGLFRQPETVLEEFISATLWLCGAVKEMRTLSEVKAEAANNQCSHLYKEIIQVAGVLL